MSSVSRRSEDRTSGSKRSGEHKKSKSKKEIEVIHNGPVYICDFCHAFLMVPDDRLEEAEVEDEDEDGPFVLLEVSYECPKCNERNIVSEEELGGDDDEDDDEDYKSKGKK